MTPIIITSHPHHHLSLLRLNHLLSPAITIQHQPITHRLISLRLIQLLPQLPHHLRHPTNSLILHSTS